MPQARIDPEELRRFIGALINFTDSIASAKSAMDKALTEVSESWDDPKRYAFEQDFHNLTGLISQFDAYANNDIIPYLSILAARAQDYLDS